MSEDEPSDASVHDPNPNLGKWTDYWLNPVPTKNAYAALEPDPSEDNQDTPDDAQTTTGPKAPRPPPIFVSQVADISPLLEKLNVIAANEYTLKIINNNQVKITISNQEKYQKVIQELKDKNTQFYTYQSKLDKGYKAVLCNMNASVDTDTLKEAIEESGHTVLNISNIRQAVTKRPLPLFFVELKTNTNSKEILTITKLMNTIVSFEPPRKKETRLNASNGSRK
ncbi:hypothetical protein TKK_0018292 [Trichogramma kaykai]